MINDLANRALTAVVRVMGEPITFNRRGERHQASGVFQAAYVAADPDTGMPVSTAQPVLLVDRWTLPFSPQGGDEVEVRGTAYKVRAAQPDGHTGFLLLLHRIASGNVFVDDVFEPGVFAA
jgi:hypothetical protein